MKPTLCLLMGQPGSGKSTFVNSLKENSTIVSRDTIRFSMVKEDEPYFLKEKAVYKEFIHQLESAADKGQSAVIYADATHIDKRSRSKLLRAINKNKFGKIGIIWVKASLADSLARNRKRTGTRAFVPEEVIHKMYSHIEPPTYEEGFDYIGIKEW